MRSIKITGVCAAVAVAIGALFASASYADVPGSEGFLPLAASPFPAPEPRTPPTSGSSLFAKEMAVLTNQGIAPARARQALNVQGKVARADLPSKLQSATGNAFAGVWFEPATAQLHIGTTSSASRRTAEGVAARVGLEANVAITPVRWTMAELLATQKRWNRKLASLFAREDVKTGLEPQRNAVSVTLTSSVPPSERAALEREAAAANVNVFVTIVASAHIGVTPEAKTECETWVTSKAHCNPSITPGVTIIKTENPECTAGPVAINNKNERVLLTAGHCLEKVGEKYSAVNKAGEKSAIGPVENLVYGGAEGAKLGDYGDILIEAGWQTGKPANPVFAVTAEWKKMNEKKEKTSYPVKGERVPVVKNTNCHIGQTSGESCGEIEMLNVTFVVERKGVKKFVEGMVEDTGENLISEGGDSGGPVLFIEEPSLEALMEGTYTGDINDCVQVKGEVEGEQFFKTQTECQNAVFPEKKGNKGSWERKEYTCENVKKNEKGPKFFKTEANCKEGEPAGEGEWKREPNLHVVYQPLRQPVEKAAEGPLEAYKLELLTKANEVIETSNVILPTLTTAEKWTGESGKSMLEVLKKAETIECTSDKSEGTFENKPLGKFHIDFEGCKTTGIKVTCTGLGEASGVILTLGTFHLVSDKLGTGAELGMGILLLMEPTHLTCAIPLFIVEGQVLCLIKPINSKVKHWEIVCEKGKEAGDPGETTYWNEAGTEVKMGGELLLSKENEGAGVMSSLSTTELILTTVNREIMG